MTDSEDQPSTAVDRHGEKMMMSKDDAKMDDLETRGAEDDGRDDAGSQKGSDEDEDRGLAGSRWEWVAACISFVLVAGAISFLLREGLSNAGAPPAITIEVDSIVPAGSGYLVEIHARNAGDRTASALQIEGVLRVEADEEASTVTLDYLPGGSVRSAGLFFSRDPREGSLEIRPTGYQRP